MDQRPISELMLRASWNEAVKRINAGKAGRGGLYQNGAVSVLTLAPSDTLSNLSIRLGLLSAIKSGLTTSTIPSLHLSAVRCLCRSL
jgi:hypothetical protein